MGRKSTAIPKQVSLKARREGQRHQEPGQRIKSSGREGSSLIILSFIVSKCVSGPCTDTNSLYQGSRRERVKIENQDRISMNLVLPFTSWVFLANLFELSTPKVPHLHLMGLFWGITWANDSKVFHTVLCKEQILGIVQSLVLRF